MHPINESIQKALDEKVFPGAHLLVCQQGKTVWDKAYGFAQVEPTQINLTKNFIFDIASLTKPFCTSLLMLQTVAQKKCSLDDSLQNFFSDETLKNRTVGQLLNHTSGLPDWKPYYQELNNSPHPPLTLRGRAWIIDKILQEPLVNEGKVVYSDLGYILLGDILEKIFQKPLDELFNQKIAKPLELKNTFFNPLQSPSTILRQASSYAPASADRQDVREWDINTQRGHGEPVEPYVSTENCPWRKKVLSREVHDDNCWAMGGIAGHSGLFSTVYDLKKIMEELNLAQKGESSWIQKEYFDFFYTIPKNRDLKKPFFTYGFDTPSTPSQSGKYFSPNTLGHLGYTGCSLWWDLDKNFYIVLLTNRVHPTRHNWKFKEYRPQLHDLVVETLCIS